MDLFGYRVAQRACWPCMRLKMDLGEVEVLEIIGHAHTDSF